MGRGVIWLTNEPKPTPRPAEVPKPIPRGWLPTRPSAPPASGAADPPASTTLSADAKDLEFYLAVEVHYHRSRQAWLSAAHRWMMFVAILFGTAAAAQLFPMFAGFSVACAAAADLCFDFVGRAAQHSDLARRYLGLARDLAGARQDKTACQKILAALIDISGDEPPVYTAAKELAHNLAIQGLGRDVAAMVAVPQNKRLLAHVCRFDAVA